MAQQRPIEPKAQAIKLLSRREHSAKELTRKLEQRGVTAEEATLAVEELGREGWQSDERYAELLVRSRISQGYGPRRIEAELRQSGIQDDTLRSALEASGADWQEQCAALQVRRFTALPRTATERAKQYRYLAGRGFDASQIEPALRGDNRN